MQGYLLCFSQIHTSNTYHLQSRQYLHQYGEYLTHIFGKPIAHKLICHNQKCCCLPDDAHPIDTLKTTLQVQGARGTILLRKRIKSNGVGSLWWGALATAAATFVGHYPWFATVSYCFKINFQSHETHYNLVQLPCRKYSRAAKTSYRCMASTTCLYWICRFYSF